MNTSDQSCAEQKSINGPRGLLRFSTLMLFITYVLIQPAFVHAKMSSTIEYRGSQSVGKTENVAHYALAFPLSSPDKFRINRLEFTVGAFASPIEDRPFISLGAVWRASQAQFPLLSRNSFIDFGFSPTWIDGSSINGRDIGGNFHFTSSLSMGKFLTRSRSLGLSLRVQHTSNGGMDSTNPGIDFVGINIAFRPGNS